MVLGIFFRISIKGRSKKILNPSEINIFVVPSNIFSRFNLFPGLRIYAELAEHTRIGCKTEPAQSSKHI